MLVFVTPGFAALLLIRGAVAGANSQLHWEELRYHDHNQDHNQDHNNDNNSHRSAATRDDAASVTTSLVTTTSTLSLAVLKEAKSAVSHTTAQYQHR